MKNKIEDIISNGLILVDARCIEKTVVLNYIRNLLKQNDALKVGLVLPLVEEENSNNSSYLNPEESMKFLYVHSKINFGSLNENNMKMIFKQNEDDILFITHDQETAFSVSNLSDDEKIIYVRRISKNGLLEPFPMITSDKIEVRKLFSYIQGRSPRIDQISYECFRPSENDIVYINDEEIVLKEEIGHGGEGIVYAINDELVAKIFSKERLTKTRIEKISMMVEKRINDFCICWPIAEVKNKTNDIVGYTMKRCNGKPISTLYRGPIVTQQLYPNFKIDSAVVITIRILNKIKKLHDNNVLLGDINDRNFLIDNLDEVFLIDTDSYQLEDYSCDVGTVGYIAPELKEGILSTTLRTFEDESYGVAVFIFRTLMQGFFPFAQVGQDEDYVKLIKKQQFPYSMNVKKTKKKVPSLAYEIWEQFSPLLMRMFINTFTVEKNDLTRKRHTVEEWIIALETQLAKLHRG